MKIIASIGHGKYLLNDIETAQKLLDILGNAKSVEQSFILTKEFTGYVMTDSKNHESVEFKLVSAEYVSPEEYKRLRDAERAEEDARRKKDEGSAS
jgi:hypothetical protein